MATKKISELPLINAVSGSQIAGGSVLPIVIGTGIQGTTNQISAENFSKFVNAYNATTGSNTFIGNQTVTGNVNISGRLTVSEVVAQYETASILFSTGSTKLGDQLTDKHEFTGSTNITGSFIYNGVLVANIDSNTIYRLQQATQSLQVASASLQAHSASVNAQLARVFQTTASIHQATASIQAYTASADSRFLLLQQTTQSLQVATASLNAFTASQDGRNFVISQYTSSTNAHIVGISDFTSSQLAVNLGNAIYTSSVDNHIVGVSIYTSSVDNHIVGIAAFTSSQLNVNLGNAIYTASVDSHIVGISTYTSSVRDTLARVHQSTASLQQATSSLQSFTASQDSRNFTLSQVTGSLIGVTNGLMAFTAALDNTYATDAQLYQLYQATRSLELLSGSMIGITNGLMTYTSSNETWKTGVRGEISAIEAWTASLDSTYATDAQLYQLYAETASIKAEIGGIESYTASLKAAAIVSSSTQIQNYNLFALTASANTFYGNQTFNNDVRANKFVFTDGVVATNVGGQSMIGTSGNILYLYTGTSGLYINNSANNAQNVTISDAGVVQTRGKLTVGAPGNDQDIAFGGSQSKLDWAGTGAQIQYSVGALQFSSVGTTNNMILQQQAGALFNAGITGSLMATNGVVSSSTQIQNYDVFALNSNLYNSTGSIKGEIAGIEAYTASLKGAIEVSGQNVNVLGMITAQQFNVTLVSSSVLYQSGSTKFGNSNDDKHEFTGSVNIGNTSHAYLNIDAGNSSANESGIYHKIGGVNKWEQYTAANDGNLNWYSQGNGIQFKIYPTQGASFTGPITASAASFGGIVSSNTVYVGSPTSTRIEISPDVMLATYGTSEKWKISRDGWVSGGSAIGLGSGTTFSMIGTNGSGNALYFSANGTFGSGTAMMTIDSSGNIGAPSGTNIYNASDIRLKKNISPISSSLSKVLQLNPVSFNWIDGFSEAEEGKELLGFVAQEVQSIIPQAIENFSNNSLNISGSIIDNPLRINEKFLIPVLTKAIQEQQTIIDSLLARIEALENK